MTPGEIRSNVVGERISWIRSMIASIQQLPLASYHEFVSDPRNAAAAESYLRRGVEALLDLGRHILAKGFAVAPSEYKEIGNMLVQEGVISRENGDLLRKIAGYRNRMVHFYHHVSQEELYLLCTQNLGDLETVLQALIEFLKNHPDKLDKRI